MKEKSVLKKSQCFLRFWHIYISFRYRSHNQVSVSLMNASFLRIMLIVRLYDRVHIQDLLYFSQANWILTWRKFDWDNDTSNPTEFGGLLCFAKIIWPLLHNMLCNVWQIEFVPKLLSNQFDEEIFYKWWVNAVLWIYCSKSPDFWYQ